MRKLIEKMKRQPSDVFGVFAIDRQRLQQRLCGRDRILRPADWRGRSKSEFVDRFDEQSVSHAAAVHLDSFDAEPVHEPFDDADACNDDFRAASGKAYDGPSFVDAQAAEPIEDADDFRVRKFATCDGELKATSADGRRAVSHRQTGEIVEGAAATDDRVDGERT